MSPRGRLAAVPDHPRRGEGVIRVSRVGQRGDDLLSPDVQRAAQLDYAAQHGIDIVRWTEVLNESGSQSRSPWWKSLDAVCERVERGETDVVLVYRYSRAARHRLKWAVAIDRIETAGGTLESATEGLDTSTSTGRFARGMLAELNTFEAERIGEQWKETHANRRDRGLPHAGYPRLGYRYAKATGYQPDPDLAPVVVELYRRYLAGQGYRPLADWLASRGVLSPRTSTAWTPRGVAYYLDSGFAAGLFRHGEQRLPGAHPPLIDARTWQSYQRERRRRGDVPARTLAPTTALAGLVRCAGCRLAMRSKADRRYGPGYLYVCDTHGCERPAHVTRARAEQAVHDWLVEHAQDVDTRAAAKTASRAERALARADVKRLDRLIADRTRELTALARRLGQELIDEGEFRAARDEVRLELEVAQREREKADDRAHEVPAAPQVPAELLRDFWKLPIVRKRELLRPLMAAVWVTAGEQRRSKVRVFGAWERLPD